MGESKRTESTGLDEVLAVDTFGGRVQVRWAPGAPAREYPKVGGVLCGKWLRIFATEARIPAFKDSVKIAIKRLYSDLQKQMSAARRPAHLLLLHKPLSYELIDGRFHKAG